MVNGNRDSVRTRGLTGTEENIIILAGFSVNLTQARVITEKGVSVGEVPP